MQIGSRTRPCNNDNNMITNDASMHARGRDKLKSP